MGTNTALLYVGSWVTTDGGRSMSAGKTDDQAALARMVRQHLNSLRGAGVEWLPAASAVPPPIVGEGEAPAEARKLDRTARGEPRPPDGEEAFLEQRRRELTLLAQEVSTCRRCPE